MTLLLKNYRDRKRKPPTWADALTDFLNRRTSIEPVEDAPRELLLDFDPSGSMDRKTLWNICTDMAINDHLREHFELPDGSLCPEDLDLPPGEKAEDYYIMLTDGFKPETKPEYSVEAAMALELAENEFIRSL